MHNSSSQWLHHQPLTPRIPSPKFHNNQINRQDNHSHSSSCYSLTVSLNLDLVVPQKKKHRSVWSLLTRCHSRIDNSNAINFSIDLNPALHHQIILQIFMVTTGMNIDRVWLKVVFLGSNWRTSTNMITFFGLQHIARIWIVTNCSPWRQYNTFVFNSRHTFLTVNTGNRAKIRPPIYHNDWET